MLSGGQKQKVALARVLLMVRPVFILDDATSNVDAGSEMRINKLLHTRLKDKTGIVISHRKSVLEGMDQVILIDEGRVVEAGDNQAIASAETYRKVKNKRLIQYL